jgi:seryl-tRNA synthetase
MIDLIRLREDPTGLAADFARRGLTVEVAALAALDAAVRRLKHEAENLRAEAKLASKDIGAALQRGEDVAAAKARPRALAEQAKELDREREARERELHDRLLLLPNPCLAEVPTGTGAADNVVRATGGTPRNLGFPAKPHWELGAALGILDLERGAKLSGSGFPVLRGLGARLQRALIAFFLDQHREHGYEELAVPLLVRPEILTGTGQLPKFEDQLYRCDRDDLYLIPTSEVPVTNLYRDEILTGPMPRKFCCHSACFRSEAGAAGIGTRGITRVHQFEKVEMVWLTEPAGSAAALESMRADAEALLQALGLPYRVLELCTGDIGFSAARTYDLEVWSPGTGTWLEVSSCSNCTDFQARRMGLRYRPTPGERPVLLHTLNGSGLALPRCLIAVLENGQQADGSVILPPVLRPYLAGCDRIAPP